MSKDGYGTGRWIDPSLGSLSGEGARQRIEEHEEPRTAEIARDAWMDKPSSSQPRTGETATYYDRPAIKPSVWKWYIPAYFFTGGVAGAAGSLGAAAQLLAGDDARTLVHRCRIVAAAGGAAGTALLIADLGRPSRFLNMVRVFRPSSPMNVGSWILAPFATLAHAAAMFGRRPGALGAVGRAAGVGAGVFGGPMTSYTGVLLSYSAVPVWSSTRRSLPVMFAGSSVAGAASLLDLMTLGPAEQRIVKSFSTAGKIVEIAGMAAVQRDASEVERVGRPLREGVSGAMWRASKVCTVASLVLSTVAKKHRSARVAAAVLGVAGSLGGRFAMFHAGTASARDPRAVFEQQRRGHGAAEVTGRSRPVEPARPASDQPS